MHATSRTPPHVDLIVPIGDFGLSAREIELIRSHARILETRIAPTTDAYYDHLLGTEYGPLLKAAQIDRLKSSRIGHWRQMLEVDLVGLQHDYRSNFGPRLLETGFPLSIFVVAAEWFAIEFSRFVDRSTDIPKTLKNELRSALLKLAFFDLALAQAAREVTYLD